MTEPRRFFPATPSANIEPGSTVALTLKLAKEVAPSVAVWATFNGEPILPTTYFSAINGRGALTGTVIPCAPTDSVAWALTNDSETQYPFEYDTPQTGPSCSAKISGGGSGRLTAIATVNGVDTGPLILNARGV